jgi:hypothetical protein
MMLMMLMGAAAGANFVAEVGNASAFALDPSDATATVTLNTDGTSSSSGSGTGNWSRPGAVPSASVRCTVTGGSLSSGTTGTWLALSSSRSWTRTRTTLGTSNATITLEYSTDGGSTVAFTQSGITLSATVEN